MELKLPYRKYELHALLSQYLTEPFPGLGGLSIDAYPEPKGWAKRPTFPSHDSA